MCLRWIEIELKNKTVLYINLDRVERIVMPKDRSEIRFVYANAIDNTKEIKDVVPIKTEDIEDVREIDDLKWLVESILNKTEEND